MKTKLGHPPWKAHSYFQVISREWLGRWREGEDMLEKAAETTATIGEYFFSCISLCFLLCICQYHFHVFCLFSGLRFYFAKRNYVANFNSLSAAGTAATFLHPSLIFFYLVFDISPCLYF